MLNNRVIPNCYMIEVRCVDGNIRHFPRDPNGLWYTSAIAGGRFGGRRPGSAGRGQREQARHAVQPAWSSRRPRVALLPNEAAARHMLQSRARVLTKGGQHRQASVERIKLDSGARRRNLVQLICPGGECATLEPSSGIIMRAARCCNKALRGFDCE